MLADYHVHTNYSDDSWYPLEKVIQDAIGLGLTDICITDHVDYGIKVDPEYLDASVRLEYEKNALVGPKENSKEALMKWLDWRREKILNVDYPSYVKEIQSLQKKYKDRINIKMGLEFGIQSHTIEQYKKLYSRYHWDFILLSIHEVDNKEFWSQEYQMGKTQDEYQMGYYNEMLKVVQNFKDYSVLAHMDMIVRYDKKGEYPFEKIKPIITEILKQVIADGKGIEVNSSCFYYGLKDLTPSRDILKLYKELGGTILTVGSDSHKEEHLGAHIQDVYNEIKKLGFEYVYTYEQMKPIAHRIED